MWNAGRMVTLAAGYLLFFSVEAAAQKKTPDTLRFATYTYSVNDRLANLRPLARYLTEKTGYPVVAVSYPTVQRLLEAIVHDSVDFAMMNTSGYLVLQKRNPGVMAPLVNLDMNAGALTNYGGCLVASRISGVTSVSQLKTGQRKLSLALVGRSSTSGNLVPRLLLNAEGIADPETKFNLYYAGTHRKAMEEVLNGRTDLAGCGCAEIDSARSKKQFDDKAVRIAEFNDIPLGPVVYNKKLAGKLVRTINKELLQLHQRNKAVFENFCAGWTEFKGAARFRTVKDADYNAFRQMFGDNENLWELIE